MGEIVVPVSVSHVPDRLHRRAGAVSKYPLQGCRFASVDGAAAGALEPEYVPCERASVPVRSHSAASLPLFRKLFTSGFARVRFRRS